MVKWIVKYVKHTRDHSINLKKCGLEDKTKKLLDVISENPYQNPPPFEKLEGLQNTYSRRINLKHRLVYQVLKDEQIIKVVSMWGHYDD